MRERSSPCMYVCASYIAFAFNPARDFGPRLLLTFAGYGKELYSYRRYAFQIWRRYPVLGWADETIGFGTTSQYWLWCPIVAPLAGAQLAAVFYDLFLNENGRFGDDEEMYVSSLDLHIIFFADASYPNCIK